MKCSPIFCVTLLFAASISAAETGWPQFRGPDGQGHATTTGLPATWSEDENITWKTPLPGKGWSSPVIAGNQIWMTAAIDTPASDEAVERRLQANTSRQPLIVSESISLRAVCVDRGNGELLHDIELMTKKEPQWVHSLNSYASPTPILDNGRLYCHFGSYGTACLDTSNNDVVWKNRELRVMHENGPGSSPVLWKNHLILHCDGSDQQFIVSLNAKNGQVAWKTKRSGEMRSNPQFQKSYCTPLIVEVNGRPQIVSPAADWVYGYDPSSGHELWKVGYEELGFSLVPRPVAGHGMVYLCTSYVKSRLLAIQYDTDRPKIVWRYAKQVSQKPSPLLVGDEIYFVSDKGGVATCLDAKSGDLIWRERLGGNFSASPLYADGRIYFFNHEGITTVVAASKKFKRLATCTLDGQIMASAAALDGAIFVRTDKALYRIEK